MSGAWILVAAFVSSGVAMDAERAVTSLWPGATYDDSLPANTLFVSHEATPDEVAWVLRAEWQGDTLLRTDRTQATVEAEAREEVAAAFDRAIRELPHATEARPTPEIEARRYLRQDQNWARWYESMRGVNRAGVEEMPKPPDALAISVSRWLVQVGGAAVERISYERPRVFTDWPNSPAERFPTDLKDEVDSAISVIEAAAEVGEIESNSQSSWNYFQKLADLLPIRGKLAYLTRTSLYEARAGLALLQSGPGLPRRGSVELKGRPMRDAVRLPDVGGAELDTKPTTLSLAHLARVEEADVVEVVLGDALRALAEATGLRVVACLSDNSARWNLEEGVRITAQSFLSDIAERGDLVAEIRGDALLIRPRITKLAEDVRLDRGRLQAVAESTARRGLDMRTTSRWINRQPLSLTFGADLIDTIDWALFREAETVGVYHRATPSFRLIGTFGDPTWRYLMDGGTIDVSALTPYQRGLVQRMTMHTIGTRGPLIDRVRPGARIAIESSSYELIAALWDETWNEFRPQPTRLSQFGWRIKHQMERNDLSLEAVLNRARWFYGTRSTYEIKLLWDGASSTVGSSYDIPRYSIEGQPWRRLPEAARNTILQQVGEG